MTRHFAFCVSVIPLFAMIVFPQTVRKYERFQAEFDRTGKTVGLTLPGSPGAVGCTNPNYKKGVITAVRYADSYKNDGNHVSGISVRYPNGKIESFDEEVSFFFSIWELPARERQPLESLFTPNRPVTVGIYYCGTAGYKRLYSVKDNSKQSSVFPRGPANTQANLIGPLHLKPDGPGCYYSLANRLVFFDGDEVWMNIDGRDVKLNTVNETAPKGKLKVGIRITKRYSAGEITVDLVETLTRMSSLSKWSGTFTVRRGARVQTVRAAGICGD